MMRHGLGSPNSAMSDPNTRRRRTAWSLCTLLLLSVAACREEPRAPADGAPEPVAAVQAMARAVAEDDLLAYARLAVPPAQYARLQQAWREGDSRWPLTELPLHDQLLPMLQSLSAPDAGASLQRSFERQLAGQTTAVRQAAQSLGQFGVQYLQHQQGMTASQQAHYIEVVKTLAEWGAQAPISDRARARASIAALTRAAAATGISDDAHLQAAGMEDSLQRLSPFLGTLAAVLATYGLDVDASLRGITGDVLSREGDNALVRLQYPLAGRTITVQVPLTRRDGQWYLTRTLADTDALLRRFDAARAAAPAVATPAEVAEDEQQPPAGP